MFKESLGSFSEMQIVANFELNFKPMLEYGRAERDGVEEEEVDRDEERDRDGQPSVLLVEVDGNTASETIKTALYSL